MISFSLSFEILERSKLWSDCKTKSKKKCTELPVGAIEGENPENPDDPKPEAAGVLNENEAADVISGFLRPKVGVAAAMAELEAGTAPNAGVFPNTGGLPEGAVANPGLGLKLKF